MDVTSLVSWRSSDASIGYPRKPLRCWRVSGVRPIPTLTLNWKTWKWWLHLGSFCFWLVVVVLIYGRVFIQDLPGFEPWNCLDDFTLLILVVCFGKQTEDLCWGGPMECHACRGWICSSCRALACLGGSSGWCTGRKGDFDVCLALCGFCSFAHPFWGEWANVEHNRWAT